MNVVLVIWIEVLLYGEVWIWGYTQFCLIVMPPYRNLKWAFILPKFKIGGREGVSGRFCI